MQLLPPMTFILYFSTKLEVCGFWCILWEDEQLGYLHLVALNMQFEILQSSIISGIEHTYLKCESTQTTNNRRSRGVLELNDVKN